MPMDELNDDSAAVACIRASMNALGISYEGLKLRRGGEILGEWDAYDVPSEAKLAMVENPDARLVRDFDGGENDAKTIMPIVRPLFTCSPEMLRRIFEGLTDEIPETQPMVEGEDFDQEMLVVPLTDAELECPECSHVGLERVKSWPAVCLTATEALNPSGAEPPASRVRSLVAMTMVCPNCTYSAKRPSFTALKERAIADLISERLKLSMPIAAKDLREYFQTQHKYQFNTAELLWASMQDYLVDLDEPAEGVVMAPLEKFVVEIDAPDWVEIAVVQLETLGWIENLEGKVFRKIPLAKTAVDVFVEPLIEHTAFPLKSLH